MSNAQFWLLVAGLALNVLVLAITGTRQLSRAENGIRDEIVLQRREIDGRIERLRLDIDDRFDKYRRETEARRDTDLRSTGEAMQAIRQKVTDMELWNRDTFARRDSVHTLAGRLETRIEALDEKMSEAFERLSDKIDERTGRA